MIIIKILQKCWVKLKENTKIKLETFKNKITERATSIKKR